MRKNRCIGFELYATALGQQYFEYAITDAEGNNLVYCQFDKYNGTGTLVTGVQAIAADAEFVGAISGVRADGMTGSPTAFVNEIDFATGTVTVSIGSTVFTGTLTGAETHAVGRIEFTGTRSKTADRSIYLDNI